MSIKIPQIQNINNQKCYFTDEEREQLSKLRIIQKNLVHFQGFPDYLLNSELLQMNEYFGQFGIIKKIVVSTKEDELTKKKSNSAYITFSNNKEAALAILSIDSTNINGNFVRAFFGTSKYCMHFLNNMECINKEKCMFIHNLANENDYLGINSKFRYSDHIKLAKKILKDFNTNLNNNKNPFNFIPYFLNSNNSDNSFDKLILPKRKNSNSSRSSLGSSTLNSSFGSRNSLKKNVNNYNNNVNNYQLFKSKDQSRFFNDNFNYKFDNEDISDEIKNLIDQILLRYGFFKKYDDFINFNDCENDLYKRIIQKNELMI